MTTPSTELTPEILDRFRDEALAVGSLLARDLEPGLTDEEIDRLVEPLGLKPPPELRTFWRWEIAPAPGSQSRPPGSWGIHPEFELLCPASAVAVTKRDRVDPALWEPLPHDWLVFAKSGGHATLVVPCDKADGPSPVIYVADGDRFIASPSLGALIEYWTEQIISGESIHERGRWWADDEARPPWLQHQEL